MICWIGGATLLIAIIGIGYYFNAMGNLMRRADESEER